MAAVMLNAIHLHSTAILQNAFRLTAQQFPPGHWVVSLTGIITGGPSRLNLVRATQNRTRSQVSCCFPPKIYSVILTIPHGNRLSGTTFKIFHRVHSAPAIGQTQAAHQWPAVPARCAWRPRAQCPVGPPFPCLSSSCQLLLPDSMGLPTNLWREIGSCRAPKHEPRRLRMKNDCNTHRGCLNLSL